MRQNFRFIPNKQSKFNFIKIAVQLCRATYTLVQRNMRSNVSRFWGAKLDLFKWTLAANIHISVDWCHTSTLLGGKNNFHYPDFAQIFMSIFGVLQYLLSASDVSMWGCLKNKTKRCFKLKVALISSGVGLEKLIFRITFYFNHEITVSEKN